MRQKYNLEKLISSSQPLRDFYMTIKLYFDELSLLTYIILFIEMTFKVAIMIKMALKISVTIDA